MKFGIIKEGKNPPDKRVPLSPTQCRQILDTYPNVEIVVETSNVRKFTDNLYSDQGIPVVDSLEDCDVIFGVKEVPVDKLIPHKTYFFFSHTIKEQPYNRNLLRTILQKKIRLVDYEVLTNAAGHRLIGFGRYAGIVGCYNAFLAYGERSGRYHLKPAHLCEDRAEMEEQLKKVDLPNDYKIVMTGAGRVGGGAAEIMATTGIRKVEPEEFLAKTFDEPVWTQLNVEDYNKRSDGKPFDRHAFYNDPTGHESTFDRYARVGNMYIACHYWDADAPFIFTREDVKSDDWNIDVVADISCDINGPVASTLRASTIEEPLYGYHRFLEQETVFNGEDAITVMAVDNLPCELPKDASEGFGEQFMDEILPLLLGNDPDKVIERATITNFDGELMPDYDYLSDYVSAVS